jgi:Holliday junction resolvase RusA-like endonuclease
MLAIVGQKKIPSKKNNMGIRHNRMYKPKELQEFEDYVAWLANQSMARCGWVTTDEPVSMTVEVVFGDKRRRDIQNCFGSVCDALNGIVYKDDSQIQFIAGRKSYKKGLWGFKINVALYNPPEPEEEWI